ncbi:MAG: NAD(P)/FAD-dependent oxidoreductase [Candidatus Omnitrophota bacterium]
MGSKARKTAVIAGAGPAGLTAAYEFLHRTDVHPVIFEQSDVIGGICRTVNYKGNRMDIGGHRFFSKSDRVMKWWQNIFPFEETPSPNDLVSKRIDPARTDKVMLIRERSSRILSRRKFYRYPLSLSAETLSNLGLRRLVKTGASFVRARIFPIRPEVSLRDFIVNRFGTELYFTFFRAYTEKVWGVPCNRIKAEWGAQRIKGLSLARALLDPLKKIFRRNSGIAQKNTETSLIERFLYPKYGPGQLWDEVARIVKEKGGEIFTNCQVVNVRTSEGRVDAVDIQDEKGQIRTQRLDYFISSMPVKDLIGCFADKAPKEVAEVAKNLLYRDFITVGVLLKKIRLLDQKKGGANGLPPDNWIYIQEEDVKVGRIQIFNNWSPYLVKDPDTVWIGMEYFCSEGDKFWAKPDDEIKRLAVEELQKLGLADGEDVLDTTLIRMKKAYPAYFGSYDRLREIQDFTDGFENLFLIGRNGMHRYNNQDHSMLAAMVAVDNILSGIKAKENLWAVNTEREYHEEKARERVKKS